MNYSFVGLLPKEEGSEFLKKAVKNTNYTELVTNSSEVKVYVSMPEFKYDFDKELSTLCRKLGISDAFSNNADFTNLTSEQLIIESILHKAHIEVDRKGTKAVAITAAMTVGALPTFDETKNIDLDRPFAYAIYDNMLNLPVFVGVVNKLDDLGISEEYDENSSICRWNFLA